MRQLLVIAEELARSQIELGLKEIDPKEYVKELVHDGMMEACYEWARVCKPCLPRPPSPSLSLSLSLSLSRSRSRSRSLSACACVCACASACACA